MQRTMRGVPTFGVACLLGLCVYAFVLYRGTSRRLRMTEERLNSLAIQHKSLVEDMQGRTSFDSASVRHSLRRDRLISKAPVCVCLRAASVQEKIRYERMAVDARSDHEKERIGGSVAVDRTLYHPSTGNLTKHCVSFYDVFCWTKRAVII